MLFALVSSAFVLRLRMIHGRETTRHTHTIELQIIPAPANAEPAACGEMQVFDNGDGTASVHFEACASPSLVTVDGKIQGIATRLPPDTRLAIPDLP